MPCSYHPSGPNDCSRLQLCERCTCIRQESGIALELQSTQHDRLSIIFDTAVTILDWFGVVVFAVSGALVAPRKQMDISGFALLGTVTGIWRWYVLRDILLGQLPVFWVREPAYFISCVMVSAAVFFTAHIPQSRYGLLLWFEHYGPFPLCDDRRRASVAGWIGTGACDCNGCDYGDVWRHRSGCAREGRSARSSQPGGLRHGCTAQRHGLRWWVALRIATRDRDHGKSDCWVRVAGSRYSLGVVAPALQAPPWTEHE